MGKRKLHDTTYFQCDWTGLPMRTTNCYMPDWHETTGKLLKHGSYCCWEAVVAHMIEQYKIGSSSATDHPKWKRIMDHITELVGTSVSTAPHWKRLRWMQYGKESRDELSTIDSANEFLAEVQMGMCPFAAVVVNSSGDASEVHCYGNDVAHRFGPKLQTPKQAQNMPEHEPQSFVTARKKLGKDRDLVAFYWPFKNGLPYNSTVSNLLKTQIYGDVIFVQQTREACFLPRERFINFTLTQYNEHFTNKTRRKDGASMLSSAEWGAAKEQMQAELQQVEAAASSNAVLPGEIAKASVLPPPTGKELARIARARADEEWVRPLLESGQLHLY